MSVNNKIGYMINESGYQMATIDIQEYKGSPNRVTGYGVLQTGNVKNRNGRIYRTEDLDREIHAPRQQELLRTHTLCGHDGHPLSSELIVQQTIDPKLCSVRFLTLEMNGDDVVSKFQGTNNDLGEAFDKDLRQGVLPAFSLRALGTIKATPAGAVVENLKMITYDRVIFPSHVTAYTHGIISESANICNNINNTNDATKSFIKEFTNDDVVNSMKIQHANESAAAFDYIKDKSFNYHLLKEAFDMTKIDMVDLISPHKIALTESGNATIVMNIEDYIAKELQNYR